MLFSHSVSSASNRSVWPGCWRVGEEVSATGRIINSRRQARRVAPIDPFRASLSTAALDAALTIKRGVDIELSCAPRRTSPRPTGPQGPAHVTRTSRMSRAAFLSQPDQRRAAFPHCGAFAPPLVTVCCRVLHGFRPRFPQNSAKGGRGVPYSPFVTVSRRCQSALIPACVFAETGRTSSTPWARFSAASDFASALLDSRSAFVATTR